MKPDDQRIRAPVVGVALEAEPLEHGDPLLGAALALSNGTMHHATRSSMASGRPWTWGRAGQRDLAARLPGLEERGAQQEGGEHGRRPAVPGGRKRVSSWRISSTAAIIARDRIESSRGASERAHRREHIPAGVSLADVRPVPVLRPPPRPLSPRQRGHGSRGVPRGPRDRHGLRGQGRLADVPRRRGAGLPAAPPPRVRDRHPRPPRLHRPLGLARRHRALRPGRRPVDDGGPRDRPRRDVPAARARGREHGRALPDLAQPAARRQDGGPLLHDALEPRDPGARLPGRRAVGPRGS